MIVEHLPHVIKFTAVEPLSVDEFPDLGDDLTGPFKSRFSSDVSEKSLVCTCEGCRNDT